MKLLLLLLAAVAVAAAEKSYNGYKVIRVYPKNEAHLEYLAEMRAKSNYDFWTEIRRDFVDIMVSPVQSYVLKAQLMFKGMESEVFIDDVQDLIELTRPVKKAEGKLALDKYNSLQAIHDWADELAAANPTWVSVESAGESYLGNDMKILRLNSNGSPHKFWIDSGIHAREWISPATVIYMVDQLVNNYEANKAIVDSFDWYILLVHNPDGYEYTHTDERLWRKTLVDHGSFWGCLGADPNRNWDFHWMDVGASQDMCSDIYAGPEPFSEPCCSTIRDYVHNLNADGSLVAYFTYHSYSQLWMSPWGWTDELPPTYDELERVGVAGMNALMDVYGTEYEFGTSTNVIYAASGASDDYAYGVVGVPFVYTIELRDQGRYGFVLPENQIIPSGEETFAGLVAAANEILVIKNQK